MGSTGRLDGSVGDACSRWSHMCGSWYFPRFLLKSWVLYMYEHGFLDGPGMIVYFLMHYAELFRVHEVSCGGAV